MEEENVRELRSSRSRSTTPYIRASHDRENTHGTEGGRRVISTAQTKGRPRVGNRQKSGVTSVTDYHSSEARVITVKHVHKMDSKDNVSSIDYAAEDSKKIGRRTDRQSARHRLQINGATPLKGDEVLAMAAEVIEEEKLQKSEPPKSSNYSAEEGQGIAYQIYKKAGDWWKCVFLHGGDRSAFAF